MNKGRVLLAVGAIVGLLVGVYSLLAIYFLRVGGAQLIFWLAICIFSCGIFTVCGGAFALQERNRRRRRNVDYLSKIIEFHEQSVRPFKGTARGCRESEIDDLEKYFGFELPAAYRQYLKFMGKDYSGIFRGSDCFIDSAIETSKYLPRLLAENNVDFALPKNYLAFFAHQGYMIAWFELPKLSDDPPVWFFKESDVNEPPKIVGSFTDSVLKDMKRLASGLKFND